MASPCELAKNIPDQEDREAFLRALKEGGRHKFEAGVWFATAWAIYHKHVPKRKGKRGQAPDCLLP